MDTRAIGKSGLLGLIVGIVLILTGAADATLLERGLTVVLCGVAGVVIGAVTEWLTSLLPTRIARTRTYFMINTAIAIMISAIITLTLVAFSPEAIGHHLWSIPLVVVLIVAVANGADYLVYRRTQQRLHAYQTQLEGRPTELTE